MEKQTFVFSRRILFAGLICFTKIDGEFTRLRATVFFLEFGAELSGSAPK
jgi:hypothetical protein